MRAQKSSRGSQTYKSLSEIYEARKGKSRTVIYGSKAVRLENLIRGDGAQIINLPKTKVYPRGEDLVIRLYDTDILLFKPDGYVEVTMCHKVTPLTQQRIHQLTGFSIHTSGQSCLSKYKTRVHLDEAREGKSQWWFKRSVPYVEGMRIRLADGEIHPDDVARIPSDTREEYQSPGKEATKAFKPIWAELKERIMFEINMNIWAEMVVAGEKPRVTPNVIAERMIQGGVSSQELLGGLLYSTGMRSWWRPNEERVNASLKTGIPNFRKNLLYAYAEQVGGLVTKGGQVLENGWYVK